MDPTTGNLVEGSIEDEANQVLKNLKSICEAAGYTLDDAVKITIFLNRSWKFCSCKRCNERAFF